VTQLTYTSRFEGYAKADLNVSRRLTPQLEGVLQVQNLNNSYKSDFAQGLAEVGRQTNVGLRWRF
jgi:hypothetical protein